MKNIFRKPHVRTDKYPKSISDWGLPSDIDGALQWDNGKTYFFKQGQYWRFNDRRFATQHADNIYVNFLFNRFTIDLSSNPFPRQTGPWWFGCPKTRPLLAQEISSELSTQYSGDMDNNYLTGGEEDLDVDTSY